MGILTYLNPNAINNNSISSSKIDGTVASKIYVDTQVKTVDDKVTALEPRVTNAVQITYSELKSLRDAGKLVPGTQYRITDYTCTTSQSGTKSAGHVFDIIVTADDESTLNEEARAALHTGDEYFSGCSLNAWQIWYCLDNDTTRFEWADTTNGKGIIYRMIDEFNNDIPYDFKNIIYIVKPSFIYFQWGSTYLFRRDASIDISIDGIQYYGYISEFTPPNWPENKCWIKEESPTTSSKLYKRDGSEISYGGEISSINLDNYETYTFGRETDLSKSGNCYNNIILPYYKSNTLTLNKIIFSSDCYNNTFRDSCYNNILGSNCRNNTFGNNCYENTFGNYCYGNTFGNYCYRNTFGNDCDSNTFGNYCGNNTFGNICYSNTFGNYCANIKFALDKDATIKYNYYKNNHFGDGCQYILFKGVETASSDVQVQNYNFAQGLKGPYNYLTINGVRNRDFETKVEKNSNGDLKIFCLADLIIFEEDTPEPSQPSYPYSTNFIGDI